MYIRQMSLMKCATCTVLSGADPLTGHSRCSRPGWMTDQYHESERDVRVFVKGDKEIRLNYGRKGNDAQKGTG